MAHYTLIARINAGNGRFPFVNVQFRKAHRPIPIAGATYYLRRSGGARTPIRIGKDLAAAHAALLHMDDREVPMAAASIWRPNRPFLIRQPLYSSKTRIALAVVDTVSYSVVYPTVWYS